MVEATRTYEHGTRAKYTFEKCRCEPCREANREYAKRTSLWNYRPAQVDAHPVREHLENLMSSKYHGAHDGMGRRRIAKISGVNEGVISRLLYGRDGKLPKRIKRENAERLMAVREDLSPAAVIDAGETWRYLNELIDFGFAKTRIARALGQSKHGGLQVGKVRVTLKTARAVERLHWKVFEASVGFRRRCGCSMPDHVAEELDAERGRAERLKRAGLA